MNAIRQIPGGATGGLPANVACARAANGPWRPCRVRRAGLTLMEVLVVVTVIGLLLGLLLPAVQASREAARRCECTSKLKQLALACQSFHAVHNRFPPGQCGGEFGFGADSTCWSWLSAILPYIEQDAIYKDGGIPTTTIGDSTASSQQISLFLCPSDPFSHSGPRTDAGNFADIQMPLGQTNYKAVCGANWGADETLNSQQIDTLWPNPGTNGSSDGQSRGDGIMWRDDIATPISAADVKDGLSNTFLIGEDRPQRNQWCSWPYSTHAYGTCAIPPNFTYPDTNKWENTLSFRSAHPGGVGFAFADGSTHFIHDGIELTLYRALATRAGGESVSYVDW